jgi:hypothetical protein
MSYDSLLQQAENAESVQSRDDLIRQAAEAAAREFDRTMPRDPDPVTDLRLNATYSLRMLSLAKLQMYWRKRKRKKHPRLLADYSRPVRHVWGILRQYINQGVTFNKKSPFEPLIPTIDHAILAVDWFLKWCKGLRVTEPEARDQARLLAPRTRIPPAKRTRPMTLREAARLMGHGNSRDAAERLRAAINAGAVPCQTLTRQQHVFSLDDFPTANWPQAKA